MNIINHDVRQTKFVSSTNVFQTCACASIHKCHVFLKQSDGNRREWFGNLENNMITLRILSKALVFCYTSFEIQFYLKNIFKLVAKL